MNVLIACECSQTVCAAFRSFGHNAFSCDIEPEYGGHPEWHIISDCRKVMYGNCMFMTSDLKLHDVKKWDLVIAHPPCTYLCNCQMPLYNASRFGMEYVENRKLKQAEAIDFFMEFTKLKCRYAIENPVGIMSNLYKKPDQVIEPYWFGDPATKRTCLWLSGLPKLTKTEIVTPPERHYFPGSNTMGGWYYKTSCLPRSQRAKARSKTFPGIAKAMAEQWGCF